MVRRRVEELLSYDKCVNSDVIFSRHKTITDAMAFSDLEVLVSTIERVVISGHYNCSAGSFAYNISVVGGGIISRYCAGGQNHSDQGRYHQHICKRDDDVRRQLPIAVKRDDLKGLTAKQGWELLCHEMNIHHIGTFFEPEVKC